MIIKIEGYAITKRETDCLFEVDIPPGFFVDEMVDVEKIEKDLGKALRSALKQCHFILVRPEQRRT